MHIKLVIHGLVEHFAIGAFDHAKIHQQLPITLKNYLHFEIEDIQNENYSKIIIANGGPIQDHRTNQTESYFSGSYMPLLPFLSSLLRSKLPDKEIFLDPFLTTDILHNLVPGTTLKDILEYERDERIKKIIAVNGVNNLDSDFAAVCNTTLKQSNPHRLGIIDYSNIINYYTLIQRTRALHQPDDKLTVHIHSSRRDVLISAIEFLYESNILLHHNITCKFFLSFKQTEPFIYERTPRKDSLYPERIEEIKGTGEFDDIHYQLSYLYFISKSYFYDVGLIPSKTVDSNTLTLEKVALHRSLQVPREVWNQRTMLQKIRTAGVGLLRPHNFNFKLDDFIQFRTKALEKFRIDENFMQANYLTSDELVTEKLQENRFQVDSMTIKLLKKLISHEYWNNLGWNYDLSKKPPTGIKEMREKLAALNTLDDFKDISLEEQNSYFKFFTRSNPVSNLYILIAKIAKMDDLSMRAQQIYAFAQFHNINLEHDINKAVQIAESEIEPTLGLSHS